MDNAISDEETQTEGAQLIDEIIRLSDFTFDRLPMLNIIGERLVDNLSVAFSDLTGALCEASLTSLDYIPMGQIIEGLPMPVLLAVGTGKPFEGEILLGVDQTLLRTSVELMLGGSAKDAGQEMVESFTAIEVGFGERLSAAVMAEFQYALSVVGACSLELDRVELEPDTVSVAKSASLCARLKYSISLAGQVGALEIVMPYDALEPIRADLGKVYFGDRGEDQSMWQGLITRQIERAHVEMEVVLAEEAMPIQKVMSWKPGDTIAFAIEEGEVATMNCAKEPMFKVSLGKKNNGFVAVQITEEISQKENTKNDGSYN